tara:strand:- start:1473 stop:1661 length:189 start_codon:yes stop_codon:yes gene_type:complete
MGEVIKFPLKIKFPIKDREHDLMSAQKLRCPDCGNIKEEEWFALYNDDTYKCLDCSYEKGEI